MTHLQQSLTQTRLLQRQWTKWFAIYAIVVYLVVNISYYTLFLSQDIVTRIYALTISITLAILYVSFGSHKPSMIHSFLKRLYGIHWIIRWYFRKIIQTKGEHKHTRENRQSMFFSSEEKLILFKERKQELVRVYRCFLFIN